MGLGFCLGAVFVMEVRLDITIVYIFQLYLLKWSVDRHPYGEALTNVPLSLYQLVFVLPIYSILYWKQIIPTPYMKPRNKSAE